MSRYVCALAVLTAVLFSTNVVAQDRVWNRYTLEGLGGVFVRTELGEPCESVGVTRRDVQVDAESILVDAEVDLLTEGEMLRNPALPELRISLECVVGEDEGASGAVGLRSGRVHAILAQGGTTRLGGAAFGGRRSDRTHHSRSGGPGLRRRSSSLLHHYERGSPLCVDQGQIPMKCQWS